jgi:hypothetical protein
VERGERVHTERKREKGKERGQ